MDKYRINNWDNQVLKIILIIGFILIIVSLFLIRNSPATGYESSIYSHVSPIVWVFLLISIAAGVYVLIRQAFTRKGGESNWWLVGFFMLLLTNFIFISLPALRGYFGGRADMLTHIGYEVDIILSGHISADNFYPIVHILTVQIAHVCNISPITVLNYLMGLVSVLCMVSIYLLANEVLKNRGWALVAAASSAVLLLSNDNVYARPGALSYLMLPMMLYLYFRASRRDALVGYKAIFIILIFFYPFLHPWVTVILIFTFIILELSKLLYGLIPNLGAPNKVRAPLSQISLTPSLLLFVAFFTWFMPFATFRTTIFVASDWLTGEVIINPTARLIDTLLRLQLTTFDNLVLLFKMEGQKFIFVVLALVAVAFIAKRVFSSPQKDMQNLFMLTIWFVIMGFMVIIGYFTPGVAPILSWGRPLSIAVLISTILVGFALHEVFQKASKVYLLNIVAVMLIITISATVGVFNLHRSKYVMQPPLQVTKMEMYGWQWFLKSKDIDVFMTDHITPSFRFANAILGWNAGKRRDDFSRYRANPVPDHFNYTEYETFGESYEGDRYMAISQYDKSVYTEIWAVAGRFNDSDYERLNYDPTIDKLYSNRELDFWYVRAKESAKQ